MMTFHRTDTCNFALMPYTNPATHLVNPVAISSWGVIKSYGNMLIDDCLDQKSAGGEVFINSSPYPLACHFGLAITFSIHGACRVLTVHPGRYIHESSSNRVHVG